MQTYWLTQFPVYNMYCFLLISIEVELLSGTLFEEHPGVATSQPTLGPDSSFPCGEISEALIESTGASQLPLGLGYLVPGLAELMRSGTDASAMKLPAPLA